MFNKIRLSKLLFGLVMLGACALAAAETVHVAVAANVVVPHKNISAQYEKYNGQKVLITSGTTGKIYAQIKKGAPYDTDFYKQQKQPTKRIKNVKSGARYAKK